jgi:hypothetical protein
MDNLPHTGANVFLLPEDSFQSMQELRDQMFLMVTMIFASTLEEEKVPLQLSRSMLAQCFQIFASQLADALDDAQRLTTPASRMH